MTLVPSTASAEVLVPVVQNKEWVGLPRGAPHLLIPTDRPTGRCALVTSAADVLVAPEILRTGCVHVFVCLLDGPYTIAVGDEQLWVSN